MSTIDARFQLQRQGFSLNASLTVPNQGVTAIFGPSGSGKTTLLRCIAGLEKADSGTLKIDGTIWQDSNRFLPSHQRQIGYVFQHANLFHHLSVKRNLTFGMNRISTTAQTIQYEDAVEWLGLSQLLSRYPRQLSGGQRQRVAIARALLTSPKLLLMDEPLSSLDIDSKTEILPYLETLHYDLNIPMLYVTHSPKEISRIADHLVLMEKGQVLATGPLNEIMTRLDLPLAHFDEASAILEGQIRLHDGEFHLTYISVPGGVLAVSKQNLELGQPVRVRILAKDVSLALHPVKLSSISNVLPVSIREIHSTPDPSQVMVKLDLEGACILSRITRRSVHTLNLEVGAELFAMVKSVALTK